MKLSHRKSLQVFYLLSITLLLLLWLEHRSINAYWVQTYHKTSPLAVLDDYAAWRMGGEIAGFLGAELVKVQDQLSEVNEHAVTKLNDYFTAPVDQQPTEELSLIINTQAVLKGYRPLIVRQAPFMQVRHVDTIVPEQESLATANLLVIHKVATPQEQHNLSKVDNRIFIDKGAKVFFVGDSLMQGVAPYAMRILLKEHGIESINLSKQSTGLAYPKFFNWPQVARDTFAKNADIKLMVVFMGPNDPWDFPVVKGGRFLKFASPEWEGVYRARIQNLINAATSHGAKVLWIGAPNMKDNKLNQGVIKLNRIYQSQVTIAQQYYTISNDVLGMKDTSFVKFMNIPNKGNVTLRTDDGIHFTPFGQKRIADKIISLLRFNDATEATKQ